MKSSQNNGIGPFDPKNKYSIYSSAISLMAFFTDHLFDVLNAKFVNLFGENWQKQFVNQGALPENFNARDMHSLLKELARNSQSQLRLPLSERIEKFDKRKKFYDELDNLLAERNAWVHRQIVETQDELVGLIELVKLISEIGKLPCTHECNRLIDDLNSIDKMSGSESNAKLEFETKDEKTSNQHVPTTKTWVIGDPVTSQFTSHSYLILENGDIKDRVSEDCLSKVNPKLQKELEPLLKNLKSGSRLRLTRDGILSAFIQDRWAFLRELEPNEWFPNHLLKKAIDK